LFGYLSNIQGNNLFKINIKTLHIIEYNTMSSEASVVTPSLELSSGRVFGRVKWFNNKAGYGFVSLVSTTTPNTESDIFVHHSSVVVSTEQYRYLVQGEYVEFSLIHTPGKEHEYQAGDVSGIHGGKLMCETRHESRQNRAEYNSGDKTRPSDDDEDVVVTPKTPAPRSRKPPSEKTSQGRAPTNDDGEWVLAVKKQKRPSKDDKTPVKSRGRPPRAKSANL
jgi:cold shock protein